MYMLYIYIYICKLWFMKWWPLGAKKRAFSIACLTVFLYYFCFCVLVLYVVWQNAVGVGFKEQVVDSNNSMYRGRARERWGNEEKGGWGLVKERDMCVTYVFWGLRWSVVGPCWLSGYPESALGSPESTPLTEFIYDLIFEFITMVTN